MFASFALGGIVLANEIGAEPLDFGLDIAATLKLAGWDWRPYPRGQNPFCRSNRRKSKTPRPTKAEGFSMRACFGER
jgi:hypothetical protein